MSPGDLGACCVALAVVLLSLETVVWLRNKTKSVSYSQPCCPRRCPWAQNCLADLDASSRAMQKGKIEIWVTDLLHPFGHQIWVSRIAVMV